MITEILIRFVLLMVGLLLFVIGCAMAVLCFADWNRRRLIRRRLTKSCMPDPPGDLPYQYREGVAKEK